MNNLMSLRTQVDQLRAESSLKREPTSRTIEEMKLFILQHQDDDRLVTGFKKKDQNPYKSKEMSCQLI